MELMEIEVSMLKQRLERVESRNRELEMRMETLQNWVQKRAK